MDVGFQIRKMQSSGDPFPSDANALRATELPTVQFVVFTTVKYF